MRHSRETVLCHSCDGRGRQSRHEVTCYHKGEYDVIWMDCVTCNNTGRVVRTTTVTFEPFQELPEPS